jgi:hypothetical protein
VIQAVRDNTMSLREAEQHYEVPKTILIDRLANRYSDKLGHPTELSKEEEGSWWRGSSFQGVGISP